MRSLARIAELPIQQVDQFAGLFIGQTIEDRLALAARLDPAFFTQPRKDLADGGLPHLQKLLQLAYRFFARPQMTQGHKPPFVGDGLEKRSRQLGVFLHFSWRDGQILGGQFGFTSSAILSVS